MGSLVTENVATTRPVLSLAEVDEAGLKETAKNCNVSAGSIQDIYSCTPLQLSMIDETRAEVFHFVLSFGPEADIDRFCEALRKVVAANAVLRTRLVECGRLGSVVQVVSREEHVTERWAVSGDGPDVVEKYLRDTRLLMRLGMPLFRSAFIGRVFVATMHHAVFDYSSWNALLTEDLPAVYFGVEPSIQRPPFKAFVARCLGTDETAAKNFWNSRFKGAPTIFPTARNQLSKFSGVVANPARVMALRPHQRRTAAPYSRSILHPGGVGLDGCYLHGQRQLCVWICLVGSHFIAGWP